MMAPCQVRCEIKKPSHQRSWHDTDQHRAIKVKKIEWFIYLNGNENIISFRSQEGVSFSIKYEVIQANNVWRRKQQVEVFERFC